MCVYNIEIDEEVVSRVRPSFKDDSALKEWMQEQIVRLMKQYVVPASSGHKVEGRKAALDFIKSFLAMMWLDESSSNTWYSWGFLKSYNSNLDADTTSPDLGIAPLLFPNRMLYKRCCLIHSKCSLLL